MDSILDMPLRDGVEDRDMEGAVSSLINRILPGETCSGVLLDINLRDKSDVSNGLQLAVGNGRNANPAGRRAKSLHPNADTSSDGALAGDPLPFAEDHWKADGEEFRRVEESKRQENLQKAITDCNDNGWTHTKLFFSHCWRDARTQERKRMLFASMTQKGLVFWADFLDLQARGPVPWRREISEGIQTCGKLVAFIDLQYLLSFNCLEELQYAIFYSKPIVIVILDQEAWNLLTLLEGAKDAWAMQPAEGGRSLSEHEGREFGPNKEPFDLSQVEHIFTTVASINFCPCRDLEFAAQGSKNLTARLFSYVEKDIIYTKEHAYLQTKAEAWEDSARPSELLLEGNADVGKWADWAGIHEKSQSIPPVTSLQVEYIQASVKRYSRRRGLLWALGIGAVALIFLLMIAAFAMMAWAITQKNMTQEAWTEALVQQQRAERQELVASAMLLASSAIEPHSSSSIRAGVRAAEIAEMIGFPALILPYLQASLERLARMPYWFIDTHSHSSAVNTVTYSPDGLYLASGGDDSTVRIRPMPKGTGVTGLPPFSGDVFLEAPGKVSKLVWSPSGNLLAAAIHSEGNTRIPSIVVWQFDKARGCWDELYQVAHDSSTIRSLAWSPDSLVLASGNEASQQVFWFIGKAIQMKLQQPGFLMPEYGVDLERIRSLDFSPNGELLAIGSTSGEVFVIRVGNMLQPDHTNDTDTQNSYINRSFELLGIADQKGDDINSLSFSPDGTLLAVGDDGGHLHLYKVPPVSTRDRHLLPPGSSAESSSAPSLQILSSLGASDDSSLPLGNINSVAWYSNGETLGVASEDHTVCLYRKVRVDDKEGGSRNGTIDFQKYAVLDAPKPSGLAMPPETHADLVSAALENSWVRSWKPAAQLGRKGPEWFNLDCIQEIHDAYGQEFSVRSASVAADGNSFVASSYRGHVCVWQRQENGTMMTLSAVLNVPQHPDLVDNKANKPVRIVRFSPSGNLFVAGDDSGGLHGWMRQTGSEWKATGSQHFPNIKTSLREMAWSWDEKWVAACGGTVIGVWNVEKGESAIQVFEDGAGSIVQAAAWRNGLDADKCYVLATGEGDSVLRIRKLCPVILPNQTVTLQVSAVLIPATLMHNGDIKRVAWSSTGLLGSGSMDGMVAIHSYEDGNVTSSISLLGHTSKVNGITWAQNGKELATSANDGTVIVWDLRGDQTGQGRGYTSWMSTRSCSQLTWLDQEEPRRLACGRKSESGRDPLKENPPFTYFLSFSLIDFDYQLTILRELQYGGLADGDLVRLGIHDLASTALNPDKFPQLVKAESAQCRPQI